MTVNPTDKFLVNRSGSSYHVDQQDLMAQLEDDDLLLVNRNSKSYKITGAEFKDSLSSPPIIQSVTLVQDDAAGGGPIQTGPVKEVNTESATYTSLIQGYSPTGSAAGFQSTNPAGNAFDGNPATNAMNESETAGAYVALDMKFINVNKIRVQFKGYQ